MKPGEFEGITGTTTPAAPVKFRYIGGAPPVVLEGVDFLEHGPRPADVASGPLRVRIASRNADGFWLVEILDCKGHVCTWWWSDVEPMAAGHWPVAVLWV